MDNYRKDAINAAVGSMLYAIEGDAAGREGLAETPTRIAKAFAHWFDGYDKNPESVLTTFADGSENYNGLIIVRDIPFYSHCEHHMAPFFGTATIGYIPNVHKPRIVGLSKLGRLLDMYAHRLQVQERLTRQIVDAMEEYLDPHGAGCIIEARHLCMESRGLSKSGQTTVTSQFSGVLFREPAARNEFLHL